MLKISSSWNGSASWNAPVLELFSDSVGKEGGKAGPCFALVIKIAEQPVVVVVTHQLVLAGPADQQVSTDAAEELVGTF